MLAGKKNKEALELWVFEYIERPQVIQAIRALREEWQQAAGDDLYQVEGNVGLILDDIAKLLGLTPEECALALGHPLE